MKNLSIRLGLVLCFVLFSSLIVGNAKAGSIAGDPATSEETAVTIDIQPEVGGALSCDGTRHDLVTPQLYGVGSGEGSGRAIGFQADRDFTINSVGILGDLIQQSFDVVIYDSPDGHSAGTVLYTNSDTTGGTGYGWNDIPANFDFKIGHFYVLNWRPTGGGDWATDLEYFHDDGLPFTVGPLNILEGMEGFDAENAYNFLHPHLRICEDSGGPGPWGAAYRTLFGQPSDLDLLRQYRDEFLAKSNKGKFYTDMLYESSEEALGVLFDNPRLVKEVRYLIESNLDAVEAVLNGNEGTITNTWAIAAFLTKFAKKSPADLRLLAITVKRQMLRKQRQGDKFLGFWLD